MSIFTLNFFKVNNALNLQNILILSLFEIKGMENYTFKIVKEGSRSIFSASDFFSWKNMAMSNVMAYMYVKGGMAESQGFAQFIDIVLSL